MAVMQAFDGAVRRRVHLFRHGDARYFEDDGRPVADPRAAGLSAAGRAQADEMGALLRPVAFDKAVATGLRRTVETAERVLAGRGLAIDTITDLAEIRRGAAPGPGTDLAHAVAYHVLRAGEPGAAFLDGERYGDFAARVRRGWHSVLDTPGWSSAALFCHGFTNRIILAWALDSNLSVCGVFEQDPCCLNVIDIDHDPASGAIIRKYLRAVNVTAYDPAKAARRSTTMEAMARRFAATPDGTAGG